MDQIVIDPQQRRAAALQLLGPVDAAGAGQGYQLIKNPRGHRIVELHHVTGPQRMTSIMRCNPQIFERGV
jgi:hypothetical protein